MKEIMTKAEFVNALAQKGFKSKTETEEVLNKVLDTFVDAFSQGKSVGFVGFGKFEVKERAARKGRNPRTKEEIIIPATKTVIFKPGKIVKDAAAKSK